MRRLLVPLAVVAGSRSAPDLDVAIPSGSPQTWGHAFPAITPGTARGPVTPPGSAKVQAGEGRTVAQSAYEPLEVDLPLTSSAGLLRILTWDLAAHVLWVLPPQAPRTGDPAQIGFRPLPGEALYWVGLAPLLRHLLHPAEVTETEVAAHLVELGAPVLAPLEASAGEQSLKALAARVAERVRFDPAPPEPRTWRDARWELLARFTREELLAEHPYDPEGAFGRRLFLIADTIEPILEVYAQDACPPLRRAAVAALTRFPTERARDVLAGIAAHTSDPVVLARACSAISRTRLLPDPAPLLARLREHRDPIETALLVDALARTRRDDVVAALVHETERALEAHSDLCVTTLGALAELWKPRDPRLPAVAAQRVEEAALAEPARFDVPAASVAADFPDGPGTRADLCVQLARIARVRLDPQALDARAALLALVDLEAPQGSAPVGRFSERALIRVHPRARILYLDLLAELGSEGQPILRTLAQDRGLDPALRGAALVRLGRAERAELAPALAADAAETSELRGHAFAVLAADDTARLVALGKPLLASAAARDPALLPAEERALLLGVVQALAKVQRLTSADLVALLPFARLRLDGNGDAPRRLITEVEALVAAVAGAERGSRARVEEGAATLLELALAGGLRSALGPNERATLLQRVATLVEGAKGHAADAAYLRMVTDAVIEALLGTELPRLERGTGQFRPTVTLPEALLQALAAIGDEAAIAALVAHLEERDLPHRPAALVALASTSSPAALRPLARALLDPDRVVRLFAYESLLALTGEDHFADWLGSDTNAQARAASLYLEGIARRR